MSEPRDDVIRIRLDTARAVEAFRHLLAEQAAAGETRAPANPAATAVWRQLAPFRLVEYGYVDPGFGAVSGAYVGFPDGSLYPAGEAIPERAVAAVAAVSPPAPLYVYLPLDRPMRHGRIERFLDALSAHLDQPLVAVLRDGEGASVARLFDAEATRAAAAEAGRHPDAPALAALFAAQTMRPDGRAYASLVQDFAPRAIEFASVAARDAFIAWTRALCDRVFATGADPERLGFAGTLRPAEIARVPEEEEAVRLDPPSAASLDSLETMRTAWTGLMAALARPDQP